MASLCKIESDKILKSRDVEIFASKFLTIFSTMAAVSSFNWITASFSVEFSFLLKAAILNSTQLTPFLDVRAEKFLGLRL